MAENICLRFYTPRLVFALCIESAVSMLFKVWDFLYSKPAFSRIYRKSKDQAYFYSQRILFPIWIERISCANFHVPDFLRP